MVFQFATLRPIFIVLRYPHLHLAYVNKLGRRSLVRTFHVVHVDLQCINLH